MKITFISTLAADFRSSYSFSTCRLLLFVFAHRQEANVCVRPNSKSIQQSSTVYEWNRTSLTQATDDVPRMLPTRPAL